MSNAHDFSAYWTDAVSGYEKRTGQNIDANHEFRKYKRLDDLRSAIDKESNRFGAYREENRKLYSKFAKSIVPIERTLQIVQKGLGNSPYAPACAVFGALSYLLQACGSVIKAYDGIEELFERMTQMTVRLREYDHGDIETSLQDMIIGILAYYLEILGKAEVCIRRKRFKQWARSVFLQEEDIKSSVDRLQKYIETELGLVTALTYRRVKETNSTATKTQVGVDDIKVELDKVLLNQRLDQQRDFSDAEESLLQRCLKTETADELAREHAANVERLTKGTGRWISEDIILQHWEKGQSPILWVFGKPGVGKSMLAASTIEMLQDKYPQHSHIPSLTSVGYVSFKENNPALRDLTNLLKALALQIATSNERFKKHVITNLSKDHNTLASARRIWKKLFLNYFPETPTGRDENLLFLIVDGLDEGQVEERGAFLSCLADLSDISADNRKTGIQVIVFTRPDVRADVEFKFSFHTRHLFIEISPERNAVDIKAYIRQRLRTVTLLRELRKRKADKRYQDLERQIFSSVLSKAQGMFLWARLVFDQIWNLPSAEAIMSSLREAPKGLHQMLYHVFQRFEAEDQTHGLILNRLLSWIFCAHRPLSLSELYVLLLLDTSQHCDTIKIDLQGRYSSIFDVIELIVKDEKDKDSKYI